MSGKLVKIKIFDQYINAIIFPFERETVTKVITVLSSPHFHLLFDENFIDFNKQGALYQWQITGNLQWLDCSELSNLARRVYVKLGAVYVYVNETDDLSFPGEHVYMMKVFYDLVDEFFDKIEYLLVRKFNFSTGEKLFCLTIARNWELGVEITAGSLDGLRFIKDFLNKNGVPVEETNEVIEY